MIIQPVILCGGSGTRLWPLSREQYPKQLLPLVTEATLLQATATRLDGITLKQGDQLYPPILVSNEEYRFITAEQLRQIGQEPAAMILEPFGRNTAPALTLAALAAAAAGADPVLLVMPADHVIPKQDVFQDVCLRGAALAQQGALVTFGITPDAPETGYGYIKVGDALPAEAGPGFAIGGFVEKPDAATAQRYLDSGEYLWNSGLFMVKASAWLAEIDRLRPDMGAACRKALAQGAKDHDFLRLDKAAFAACPADSIDYAVAEKVENGKLGDRPTAVLPLDAGWSDVGAWDALWQVCDKDGAGNVTRGDVIAVDSRDSLVLAQSRLVACVGLDDMVVVETPDAVMVAHKDRTQDVKEIVNRLKKQNRKESVLHRQVYRPWGYYDSIDGGERFQVKRIVVKPGASLSLQLHHHRAEHWIVVRGTARVTRGEEVFLLAENQSTYIPLGTRHRLENPGKLPLEMIEVQSGSYLGEDDIVRFEDTYGRG